MTTSTPNDIEPEIDDPGTEPSVSPVRFAIEAAIGVLTALAVCLALLASTGEIPFVYQGY